MLIFHGDGLDPCLLYNTTQGVDKRPKLPTPTQLLDTPLPSPCKGTSLPLPQRVSKGILYFLLSGREIPLVPLQGEGRGVSSCRALPEFLVWLLVNFY